MKVGMVTGVRIEGVVGKESSTLVQGSAIRLLARVEVGTHLLWP